MATKTEVIRTDDLTGKTGEDIRNFTFSLSGAEYEIDLDADGQTKLFKALDPFIRAGRPIAAVQKRSGARPPRPSEENTAGHVRAWARTQGIEVPPRGRVPKDVVAQWEAAGSPS